MTVSIVSLPADLLQHIIVRWLLPCDVRSLRLACRGLNRLLGDRTPALRRAFEPRLALNRRNMQGTFPLLILLERDSSFEDVQLLLEQGARADVRESTCGRGVFSFQKCWKPAEILLLLRHGADPMACGNGGTASLRELFSGRLVSERCGRGSLRDIDMEAVRELIKASVPPKTPGLPRDRWIQSLVEAMHLLFHADSSDKLPQLLRVLQTVLDVAFPRMLPMDREELVSRILLQGYASGEVSYPASLVLLLQPTLAIDIHVLKKFRRGFEATLIRLCDGGQPRHIGLNGNADWLLRYRPHHQEIIRLLRFRERFPTEPLALSSEYLSWLERTCRRSAAELLQLMVLPIPS